MFEVTNSEIDTFKMCRYKWYLTYIKRLTSKTPVKAFEDGTIFHSALENLSLGVVLTDVVGIITKDYEEVVSDLKIDVTDKMLKDYETRKNIIQALVIGYHNHYKDIDNWDVLDTEMEFSFVVEDEDFEIAFTMCGKKDMIVNKGKHKFIVEHKSAGKLSASYIGSIDMKPQPLTYLWEDIVTNPDNPVEGLIFDVAKKSAFKQGTDESNSEYITRILKNYKEKPEKNFYREEIRVSKKRLKRYEGDVIKVVRDMIDCQDKPKEKVYRNENHCYQYGPCPYLKICKKRSIKGEHMTDFYKRDRKHAELNIKTT